MEIPNSPLATLSTEQIRWYLFQRETKYLATRSSYDLWKYFVPTQNGRTAICKLCGKVLKTTGGCVIGLRSHLYGIHGKKCMNNFRETSFTINDSMDPRETFINMNDDNVKLAVETININGNAESTFKACGEDRISKVTQLAKSAKKRRITDYKPVDTIETVVSRMVALDGANLKWFTESEDLRNLFLYNGYNLPKSTNSIIKMIMKKADDAKEEIKEEIVEIKKAGHKLTLSLDHWESIYNKHYINVSLHCKAISICKTLGPVNISETASSAAAFIVINDYLKRFNVSIQEDIISLTTDGSGDMRKIGIHFNGNHQWCLGHGVQAAILITMYKAIDESQSILDTPMDVQYTDTLSEDDDDSVNCDEFEVEKLYIKAELRSHKVVIEKLRCVIKMIKNSQKMATSLKAHVMQNFNDSRMLKIDNRSNWTSMIDMIGSFLKIKECVLTILHENETDIVFTAEELSCLNNIYITLDLVRLLILSLCRNNATLFSADVALRCSLIELEVINTDLSLDLAANLRKRIKDRRLLIAGVLHYLHDLKSFTAFPDDDTTFLKPTSKEITEHIVNLLKQFKSVAEDLHINETPTCSKNNSNTVLISNIKELKMNNLAQLPERTNIDLETLVVSEREIYEKNGERGICLTKAYEYLLAVMPTNVQTESLFAVCDFASTRIVSSHSDQMLQALIFLRTHYRQQRHIS